MDRRLETALERLEVGQTFHAVSIGDSWVSGGGVPMEVRSPIDGALLATMDAATQALAAQLED